MNRTVSSAVDVLVVVIVCFGWPIFGSVSAVMAGFPAYPFTDVALLATILFEMVVAAIALGYLHFRGYELRRLIAKPTFSGSLKGVGLYILIVFVYGILRFALAHGQIAQQPIDKMVEKASISLGVILIVSVVNGLYEEMFLIGFIQRVMEPTGASFAIGITLLVRLLCHLYQGPIGAAGILGFGLTLSIYYWRTKQLWPVIFAHMLSDAIGFSVR